MTRPQNSPAPSPLGYEPPAGEKSTAHNLRRWNAAALILTLFVCVVAWAIVALACLCVGSNQRIGWPDAATRAYRLDPVLLASVIGASLGAAGVVYQAILRNPLADPYLLGVSSGASLFAFIWRLPFKAALAASVLTALGQQTFSFAGAIISIAAVLLLARRGGRLEPVTLLLVGVIVNAINGAVFLFVYSLYPEIAAGAGSAMGFLIGGIQTNLTSQQRWLTAGVFAGGWFVLLWLSGKLNAATLSEAEAESLGVDVQRVRWVGLIVASIVTAAAVAVSGPIGFVGLICPHLTRHLVGPDQRRLLPAATAAGAALLAIADAATRLLSGWYNTLLPVGVLTALLGGPFFLLLLWKARTPGRE